MVEIPKDAQQLLGQAQLYQQQLQGIMAQKEVLTMQLSEIDKALEALEATKEKEVFKIAGPVLIKEGKAGVKTELKEKRDAISLRAKGLEKTEKKLKTQLEGFRAKLSESMG